MSILAGITGRPSAIVTSTADIGDLVTYLRKQRGYSQQAFADLAGVGRRFISELESGKPTAEIGKVLKVLTALGVDIQLSAR